MASHQPFPSQVPIMQCLPGPGLRAKSAPSSLARTGLAGEHCRSGCRRWRGWTRGFWGTGEGSGQRLPGRRHGMKGRADRAAESLGAGLEGGALPWEFSCHGPHILHLCEAKTSLGVRAKLWAAQPSAPGFHSPDPPGHLAPRKGAD